MSRPACPPAKNIPTRIECDSGRMIGMSVSGTVLPRYQSHGSAAATMPQNNHPQQENSPVNNKYVPEPRLVDDPERLEELYCEQDLTIIEIADEHAEHEKTSVYNALVEFGLTNLDAEEASSDQSDHSDSSKNSSVNWSRMG